MKYLRSVWTFGLLGLLLAACSSAEPPTTPTDADIITNTRRMVDVSYTLEARFAAYPRGDVNRDRRITGADLVIVSNAIESGDLSDLSDFQLYQADYTCDGILSIDDIRGIQARQRNDKAPPEVQVCQGNSDDDSDDELVLLSNIGDLPFNGLSVTGSAGISVRSRSVNYFTFNPTTFVYTFTVAEGITSGSLIISAGNITTVDISIVQNIAEVVASRPELSVLLDAVLATGLAGDLTADGELTVFAPNNQAFINFLAANNADSLEALINRVGIERISELLQFHIVLGTLSAADLLAQINENGGNTIVLETLTGGGLTVSLVDGNVVLQDDNTVIEANVDASNGIIHVVDGVLTYFNDPLKVGTITLGESVSGVLEPTDSYVIFELDDGTFVRDYRDEYTLEGVEAGQTITVTLESDDFDPFIRLFDSSGFSDFFDTGTVTFEVDPDTTFSISAEANTLGDLGAYTLTASLATEPVPGTIAEIATATPDLSSLVGALNADQAALLSDETQALTVLAPVNSAFAAASDLLATLSAEQVATVINYHVLAGEFLAADVVALDGQTLPGSDITVSVTEAGVFLQGAGNDAPIQVIQTDIDASNGVVHLLDGILLPAELPGITTFEVMLEGGQQNPPVTTDGMGSVTITLNEGTSVMTLTGSVSNLSSPLFDVNPDIGSVHIHEAPRGENGPVIFPIDVERIGDGTSATLSLTATLTNEQVSTLQAGGYYINVHTENFNGGEIRGQIE